jgi:hypothetical protein
MLGRGRCL